MDHSIFSLHVLACESRRRLVGSSMERVGQVWGVTEYTTTCFLPGPGKYTICPVLSPVRSDLLGPISNFFETRTVGLLPVLGPCYLKTKGLRWELGPEDRMEMGCDDGIVSCSNEILQESDGTVEVEVLQGKGVFWSTEVSLLR